MFSSLIRNLTDIEDNKDNAPKASDNYGLFILREKKHSCACSCSYGHFNLESYTVLNLMKRTYPLYGHFALSIRFLYYRTSSAVFFPLYM